MATSNCCRAEVREELTDELTYIYNCTHCHERTTPLPERNEALVFYDDGFMVIDKYPEVSLSCNIPKSISFGMCHKDLDKVLHRAWKAKLLYKMKPTLKPTTNDIGARFMRFVENDLGEILSPCCHTPILIDHTRANWGICKKCKQAVDLNPPSPGKDQQEFTGNKYHRKIIGLDGVVTTTDIYRFITAFDIKEPGLQHALKKIACAGIRGKNSFDDDLKEAIDAITATRLSNQQKETK